jgi:hypothetical protein
MDELQAWLARRVKKVPRAMREPGLVPAMGRAAPIDMRTA